MNKFSCEAKRGCHLKCLSSMKVSRSVLSEALSLNTTNKKFCKNSRHIQVYFTWIDFLQRSLTNQVQP